MLGSRRSCRLVDRAAVPADVHQSADGGRVQAADSHSCFQFGEPHPQQFLMPRILGRSAQRLRACRIDPERRL
jgi:hypothetical protein